MRRVQRHFGDLGFEPYVERFCSSKHWKPNRCSLEVEAGTEDRKYITINDPAVLVRFVGYVMRHYHQTTGGAVFMRAQDRDYGTMKPSLFRDLRHGTLGQYLEAYEAFIKGIKREFAQDRFKTREVGALLQHYGIKTPWLDVVDNLYTAMWFATSGLPLGRAAKESWLFLIGTGGDALPSLRVENLRTKHSSLTLRAHAQHGFSLTRPRAVIWNEQNVCFNEYVLAAVRIEKPSEWAMSGKLCDRAFFFPSADADHTFGVLRSHRMKNVLASATSRAGLPSDALGTLG